MDTKRSEDYKSVIQALFERIRQAQYNALKTVNRELIALYFDIGRTIVEKQQQLGWGDSIVIQLARDLQVEFPGVRVSLVAICSACAGITLHTRAIQKSRQCLDKYPGRTTR